MKRQSKRCLILVTALMGSFVTGCATKGAPKTACVSEPEFLTLELKKQNLLCNPSFEDADSYAWTLHSHIGNTQAGRIVPYAKARDGKRVAFFDTGTNHWDLVTFMQTVRVKPKTKYLFSGWAKFEDVALGEDGQHGPIGVNLGVQGTWDRSPALLLGTKDWTYISYTIDSGERTSLDVAAKLGHWCNGCFGRAWFDDLCLIELPPLPDACKP